MTYSKEYRPPIEQQDPINIPIIIGNGVDDIDPANDPTLEVWTSFPMDVVGWIISSTDAGAIDVDVLYGDYASYPSLSAIAQPPTLSAGTHKNRLIEFTSVIRVTEPTCRRFAPSTITSPMTIAFITLVARPITEE